MRKYILLLSIFCLIFIDLGSKYFVENSLFGVQKQDFCTATTVQTFIQDQYCNYNTITLNSWLSIKLSYNTGIAFSLPISGIFLQILTGIIVIGLIFYYIGSEYSKNRRWMDFGFILLMAGSLAHLYERIVFGSVIDFIAVKYFAILNFADILISIGGMIILFYSFLYDGRS